MKRVFKLEIEYNELQENILNNSKVLGEVGLEIALENYMEGFKESKSIKGDFSIKVNEVGENEI